MKKKSFFRDKALPCGLFSGKDRVLGQTGCGLFSGKDGVLARLDVIDLQPLACRPFTDKDGVFAMPYDLTHATMALQCTMWTF